MTIEQNVRKVENRIINACEHAGRSPEDVKLIAVTKTVDTSVIEAAFNAGIRDFGENRIQEAKFKIEQLYHLKPHISWHMVGHLQTNKAKTAVDIFDIIHSIDSIRLAESLSSLSPEKLPVLVEVNISAEYTKGGFTIPEAEEAIRHIAELPQLEVRGLMTVAPMVPDPEDIRPVFRRLKQLADDMGLKHLSMGMTDDFEVAIEEGATMIRVGRAIFGERR